MNAQEKTGADGIIERAKLALHAPLANASDVSHIIAQAPESWDSDYRKLWGDYQRAQADKMAALSAVKKARIILARGGPS
jgi:hypothetical protein